MAKAYFILLLALCALTSTWATPTDTIIDTTITAENYDGLLSDLTEIMAHGAENGSDDINKFPTAITHFIDNSAFTQDRGELVIDVIKLYQTAGEAKRAQLEEEKKTNDQINVDEIDLKTVQSKVNELYGKIFAKLAATADPEIEHAAKDFDSLLAEIEEFKNAANYEFQAVEGEDAAILVSVPEGKFGDFDLTTGRANVINYEKDPYRYEHEDTVNSNVVGVRLYDDEGADQTSKATEATVTLTLNTGAEGPHVCVGWKANTDGTGQWSDEGLTQETTASTTTITCKSTHLTDFAIKKSGVILNLSVLLMIALAFIF